eukprot:m.279849 g.279849  ORF g.279849 m.279849 type:complete len:363 (+) comp40627_c0_seq9:384-1472(+)
MTLDNFNGQTNFTVSSALMACHLSHSRFSHGRLVIYASVTDQVTGKTLHSQASSSISEDPITITLKFHESTPMRYKPELKYAATIVVAYPDSPVPDSANLKIDVTLTIETSGPDYRLLRELEQPYAVKQGVVEVEVDIPSDIKTFNIRASRKSENMHRPVRLQEHLSTVKSPSNSYIQVTKNSTSAQAGNTTELIVRATFNMTLLYYKVISRSDLVSQGTSRLTAPANMTLLSVVMTNDMAPLARLVVYAVRSDGEVVADSIAFDVIGLFKNKVTIDFSKKEEKPGSSINLRVTASPNSYIGLLAIDRSAEFLATSNDIGQSFVTNEIRSYDSAISSKRTKSRWLYSGQDTYQIFEVITYVY